MVQSSQYIEGASSFKLQAACYAQQHVLLSGMESTMPVF